MLRQVIYRSAPVIFVPKPDSKARVCKIQKVVLPKESNLPIAKVPRKLSLSEAEFLRPARLHFVSHREILSGSQIKRTETFEDTNPREHARLFVIKCQVCSHICDFTCRARDAEEKAIKVETLNELIRFIMDGQSAKKLTSEMIAVLFSMVRNNIQRCFPYVKALSKSDIPVDDEWEHVERVYKVLITILESKDVRLGCLQSHINESFVNLIFKNVAAPDPREQRLCCVCLCRIMDKFFGARKLIVAKTNGFLKKCLYESRVEQCLPCFLRFYLEVIEFSKPSFSSGFLTRVILPFINSDMFPAFRETFDELMHVFFEQDVKLVATFLRYSVRHWPFRNAEKQSALLRVVKDALLEYGRFVPKDCMELVLARIAGLFNDMAEDLSQQSLALIADGRMAGVLTRNGKGAVKMLIECATRASTEHWLPSTREKALDVLNRMKSEFLCPDEETGDGVTADREETWKIVRDTAEDKMTG